MGFSVDRSSGHPRLVINEAEATMVRRAVSLLLDHGMTTGEAAQALNAEGLLPRKAARWHAALLRNHLMRGAWGGVWTYAKPASRTKTEAMTVAVPQMLSPERHQALLNYLKVTTSPKTRSHVHPLSGVLIGECGHAYTGVARRDRGRRRYRCSCQKDTGKGWTCPAPTVLADALDDLVWAEVVRVLKDPALLQKAAADSLGILAGSAAAEADGLARAEAEVLKCETALSGAFSAGLKAGLDSATLDQVVEGLKGDLAEARLRAQSIRAMQEQTSTQRQGLESLQEWALGAGDDLDQADAAFRRDVLVAIPGLEVRVPELGPEGVPLRVEVIGGDVLGLLGISAGQGVSPQERGGLSLLKRTSR